MNQETAAASEGSAANDLGQGERTTSRRSGQTPGPRSDGDGMRNVRISEEAYQAARSVGHAMRRELGGYKPDVCLVISALVEGAAADIHRSAALVRGHVLGMFKHPTSEADGEESQ